jgi:hypothetical protein
MPIRAGATKAEAFHDLRHGKAYKKTRAKFGKKKAQQQMVARYFKHERGEDRPKGKKRRSTKR